MRLSTLFEPNYHAAVAIVINSDKLLLGKASNNDDRRGKWCFPGGRIERGEAPEKTAMRECLEETGIECQAIQGAVPHKSKPGVAFVVCKSVSGDLRPNHEFSSLGWVKLNSLDKLQDLYPPNIQIIQDII